MARMRQLMQPIAAALGGRSPVGLQWRRLMATEGTKVDMNAGSAPKVKSHAFFTSWILLMCAGGGKWFINKYREVHYSQDEPSYVQKQATIRRMTSQEAEDAGPLFIEVMKPDGTSFIQRRTTLKTRLSMEGGQGGFPPLPKGYSQPSKERSH